MSNTSMNFMELSLRGLVMTDEIDDYVDLWHEHPRGKSLGAYLGMTDEEYSLWVRSPDALPLIVAARHDNRPLTWAVNDNLRMDRLAARADDSSKIKRLKQWLKHRKSD